MKDVDDYQSKEVEYDISFIPKMDMDEPLFSEDANMYEPLNDSGDEDAEKQIDADDSEQVNHQEKTRIDSAQEDRTSFYSSFADSMDEIQYDVFSKCRQQNFLSRGKEAFLEWTRVECSKQFIEHFGHLAYHEVRTIIESSIKDTSNTNSLVVLANPLTYMQVKSGIEKRNEELEADILKVNESKGKK